MCIRLTVCIMIGKGLVIGKIVLVLAVLVSLFVLGEKIGDGARAGWERRGGKGGCRCRVVAIDSISRNGGRRMLEIAIWGKKRI